jgi:HAD superfamily hydrolase (TIGR01459 family)
MVQLKKGLYEIIDQYDGFILDIYGVLHDGIKPFADTLTTLEELQKHKKNVVLLSNAPRRSQHIKEQLHKSYGISPDLYQDVYSSGEHTFQTLKACNGKKTFFYGDWDFHGRLFDDLSLEFTDDIESAQVIINTGPVKNFPHDDDVKEFFKRGISSNLPMICANPDIFVMLEGKQTPCAGYYAKIYEELGGHVQYLGKPHKDIYQALLAKIDGIDINRILAVGDSLHTDIQGANGMNIDSLLVATGLHGKELGSCKNIDHILLLAKKWQHIPTYVMQAFRFV